jgi:hypothetical protein
MYYYWITIAILLAIALLSYSHNWSPFQSDQVRQICVHMTKKERGDAVRRGAVAGLLIGLVWAGVGLLLGVTAFKSATAAVALCLLLLPLLTLVFYRKWWPRVIRSQQEFLASTAWAKSQGIQAKDIRLYTWQH